MSAADLTDAEVWTAINALRVAATQYDADAEAHAATGLMRQFQDQAIYARDLADKLEALS